MTPGPAWVSLSLTLSWDSPLASLLCQAGGLMGVPPEQPAGLGDPTGHCSRAAVFPGTETLLIDYPKILTPWSKASLGVSRAELQFPVSAQYLSDRRRLVELLM